MGLRFIRSFIFELQGKYVDESPHFLLRKYTAYGNIKKHIPTLASECASYFLQSQIFYPGILYYASAVSPSSASSSSADA